MEKLGKKEYRVSALYPEIQNIPKIINENYDRNHWKYYGRYFVDKNNNVVAAVLNSDKIATIYANEIVYLEFCVAEIIYRSFKAEV